MIYINHEGLKTLEFKDKMNEKEYCQFIDRIINLTVKPEGEKLKIFNYGKISSHIADIAEKAGMNIKGNNNTITDSMIIHDRKKHHLKKEDFLKLPEVANDPNYIYAGIRKGTQNPNHIALAKKMDGKTYVLIVRHFQNLHELRGATFYKRNKILTDEEFIKAVNNTYGINVSNVIFLKKN